MSSSCGIGRHNWNGCKCWTCGRRRLWGHNWALDCQHCYVCGATRRKAHAWADSCKCRTCGKTRDTGHDWADSCKCRLCGMTRDVMHDFSSNCERCRHCGGRSDQAHDWRDCRCQICGTEEHEMGPVTEINLSDIMKSPITRHLEASLPLGTRVDSSPWSNLPTIRMTTCDRCHGDFRSCLRCLAWVRQAKSAPALLCPSCKKEFAVCTQCKGTGMDSVPDEWEYFWDGTPGHGGHNIVKSYKPVRCSQCNGSGVTPLAHTRRETRR